MKRMQIMLAVIAIIAIVSLALDTVILFRLGDGSGISGSGQIEIQQPDDSLGGQLSPREEDEERELEDEEERQQSEEPP